MNKTTIIRELAFEMNCTQRKALEIYEKYKNSNKLSELLYRLKYHKEV